MRRTSRLKSNTRGRSVSSAIVALKDNVDITRIDGTVLKKKGDSRSYDFDIKARVGGNRGQRTLLKSLIAQGYIKVVYPDAVAAAKAVAERAALDTAIAAYDAAEADVAKWAKALEDAEQAVSEAKEELAKASELFDSLEKPEVEEDTEEGGTDEGGEEGGTDEGSTEEGDTTEGGEGGTAEDAAEGAEGGTAEAVADTGDSEEPASEEEETGDVAEADGGSGEEASDEPVVIEGADSSEEANEDSEDSEENS